jgi:hypothetical protein
VTSRPPRRAELNCSPSHVKIAVQDDHVLRPSSIRLTGDSARDRGVLDEAADDDVLARLHVRADADSELRVAPEALFTGHETTLPERVGTPDSTVVTAARPRAAEQRPPRQVLSTLFSA